ncbi:MAG: hypothetical protein GXY55_07570 [Phycisphaerae bacterium]|nr:hypothetical protein [Phycisphaerae bacterium]
MSENHTVTTKDFAIGVLSVTAVVLLAAFLFLQALLPQQAMAFAQTAMTGRFQLATAQLDNSAELLAIFDSDAKLMNVYAYDVGRGEIVLIRQLDVERLTARVAPRSPRERRR